MTLPLTAIVLTYNEARHIGRCLDRLEGLAARVVVVDSHSTDATCAIARARGAEVLQNPWVNYATQFQWALDHAGIDTPWTLRIDADEYMEAPLQDALRAWFAAPKAGVNGLYLRRKIVFLGQPITHGHFYPLLALRLWRTGAGRMEQRWMDEHIVLDAPRTEILPGDLADHNLNDISWWIAKHDGYATREAYDMVAIAARAPRDGGLAAMRGPAARKRWLKERVYARLPSGLRASLYFLYRYGLGLGFLDGRAGFYFHALQAFWYRTLVEAKLYELAARARARGLTPYALLQAEGIFPR